MRAQYFTLRNYSCFPSSQERTASSMYTLADGGLGDWFGSLMYSAGQQANEAVQIQLGALSFTRFAKHLYIISKFKELFIP